MLTEEETGAVIAPVSSRFVDYIMFLLELLLMMPVLRWPPC